MVERRRGLRPCRRPPLELWPEFRTTTRTTTRAGRWRHERRGPVPVHQQLPRRDRPPPHRQGTPLPHRPRRPAPAPQPTTTSRPGPTARGVAPLPAGGRAEDDAWFRRDQASITRPSSSRAPPATPTRPDHLRSSATGSTCNEGPTVRFLWRRRSRGLPLHPPRRASPGTGCSPITVGNPTNGRQEGLALAAPADGRAHTAADAATMSMTRPTNTATTTTSMAGPTSIRRGSSGTDHVPVVLLAMSQRS